MSRGLGIVRAGIRAVLHFLLLTLAITLIGALVGTLLFLLVGKLFGMDYSTGELVKNGFYDGGFFALIWAPGISFVYLVMRAYRSRQD